MIRIITIVISSLFLFDRFTRKYLNPYKLIFCFGKKGSGKTTYLTRIAIKSLKQGKKVYSTVEIPGTYLFDVEEVGKKTFDPKSIVLIDEIGMIWDARDFSKFPKEVRDFFKYQRQYKLTVYVFSQTFDVDKKIRDVTDEMWLLTSFMRVWSMQRRIIKKIGIKTAADGSSTLSDDYKFDSLLFGGMKFIFIPRWVPFFKSYDPKKLAYIDGKYCDMSDIQQKYLVGRNWVIDCIKVRIVSWFCYFRSLFNKLIRRSERNLIDPD